MPPLIKRPHSNGKFRFLSRPPNGRHNLVNYAEGPCQNLIFFATIQGFGIRILPTRAC